MKSDNDERVARADEVSTISNPDKPYRVLCISMYESDIARVEEMLATLKARGIRRANRSWLIRLALSRLDVDDIGESDRP